MKLIILRHLIIKIYNKLQPKTAISVLAKKCQVHTWLNS